MKTLAVVTSHLCCLMAAASLSGCVSKSQSPAKLDGGEPSRSVLKVETLCTPVVTSRLFSMGVAPNMRGGWTFVGECLNYRSTMERKKETIALPDGQHYLVYKDLADRPEAEWVVADLKTGKYKIVRWPGFHSSIPPCLAGNGRLFFSVDYAHIYYYEPTEDTVKPLGRVCDDLGQLRFFYKLILGPDGMVYGSAQATSGVTTLMQLNPDTLEYKLFDKVGLPGRRENLTYGYYLAVDPPWMYVAVGQGNWELFAVNADTGEKKCLADLTGDGTRITVSQDKKFCTAQLTRPGVATEKAWLVDGKMILISADGKTPEATPISQKQYRGVVWKNTKPMDISNPPELETIRTAAINEKGRSEIFWRPAGTTGEWNRVPFAIQNAEPARIESLIALPDGSLLGNVFSYNGFFRYHPATRKLDYFGKHGPSRNGLVLLDGKVYICGYPNTMLLAYDPTQPWTSSSETYGKAPGDNPKWLGTMGQGCTEAHYCRGLYDGGNGRIYLMGRRERWSTGTGLGYYEPSSGKFFGLGAANKEIESDSMTILPKLGRIVFSGTPKSGKDARLIVYDMDLKEIERIAILPGLASGGGLFPADSGTAFLGNVQDPASKQFLFYRYDLADKKIVKRVEMPASVEDVFRRPTDGTWWALSDGALYELNTKTLELRPLDHIEGSLNYPTWVGKDLYGTQGGELVRVRLP